MFGFVSISAVSRSGNLGWLRALVVVASMLAAGEAAAVDLPARRYITVVGSSTAYPIVATAAEHFSRSTQAHAPVVESTGTGGGFKLFCAGVGLETPDVVMASRPMKPLEWKRCRDNGVVDVLELKIGYDGIAVVGAREAPPLKLTRRDLYLALAKEVPDPAGRPRLLANPYRRWSDIDPELPDMAIRVYGPPPTSGTRDILVERVLANACAEEEFLEALREQDKDEYRVRCQSLREDGLYIDSGEDDSRLVRKVTDDPEALAILGFNFLDRNSDRLRGAEIDGVAPAFERIEAGDYPIARPLYLYVKKAHGSVLPDLAAFVREIASSAAWGDEGYLVDKGLIPMPEAERELWRGNALLEAPGCSYPDCP